MKFIMALCKCSRQKPTNLFRNASTLERRPAQVVMSSASGQHCDDKWAEYWAYDHKLSPCCVVKTTTTFWLLILRESEYI